MGGAETLWMCTISYVFLRVALCTLLRPFQSLDQGLRRISVVEGSQWLLCFHTLDACSDVAIVRICRQGFPAGLCH
eukprot:789702-Pyramimonas_sp.AAC.1